mmetsp:Transcript_70732/g.112068  ORF Transcript_70732/g.112068 Transcript_70732/m.112068 type:complete len:80 (-) Transcript_70732:763-1002(-)
MRCAFGGRIQSVSLSPISHVGRAPGIESHKSKISDWASSPRRSLIDSASVTKYLLMMAGTLATPETEVWGILGPPAVAS